MSYQMQYPLPGLPLHLILVSNGTLAFAKNYQDIPTIYDQSKAGGVDAIFDNGGFTIGKQQFSYNVAYAYKNIPAMLQWLQQQNLQQPERFMTF